MDTLVRWSASGMLELENAGDDAGAGELRRPFAERNG
jgi:hypothetical protein